MEKEIKATAPTPQDWIDLVRENEKLRQRLELAESCLENGGKYRYYLEELKLENKTND